MRELLISQTVGGDALDGLEERRLGEVGGPLPHRREHLANELSEARHPGLNHGLGSFSEARRGAIGVEREWK